MLYDFNSNILEWAEPRRQSTDQGLPGAGGREDEQGAQTFRAVSRCVHTVLEEPCPHTFVQTHSMCTTRSEPDVSCGLQ